MKKVAILQSNYIPWKGYFDLIKRCDVFVVYDEVQYTKNDWRNRNIIKSPNGSRWLTIPVRQETLDQRICDTNVVADKWARKHLNALMANYAKAPHFKERREWVSDLYMQARPLERLTDINKLFLKEICIELGILTEFVDSRDLHLIGDRNKRLIDAVLKLEGTHYLSGPAAKSYLDVHAFEESGIQVEWMDYSNYPEYPQLFPPFEHGVSILDMIFNLGHESNNYLKKKI